MDQSSWCQVGPSILYPVQRAIGAPSFPFPVVWRQKEQLITWSGRHLFHFRSDLAPISGGATISVSGLGDRSALFSISGFGLAPKGGGILAGSGADLGIGLGVLILPQLPTAPKLSPTLWWGAGSLAEGGGILSLQHRILQRNDKSSMLFRRGLVGWQYEMFEVFAMFGRRDDDHAKY